MGMSDVSLISPTSLRSNHHEASDAVRALLVDASGNALISAQIAANGDAASNTRNQLPVESRPALFNGTTWDRARGWQEGTLLTSAARTAQTDSAVQTNYGWRGIILFLSITAASGSGGLQVRIIGVNPADATNHFLNSAPTAKTATGQAAYAFYPGTTTGGDQGTPYPLPRTWFARVQVGDSSSYTYSLSYCLIP